MMQSLLMFLIIICFYFFLADQGDLVRARGIKHSLRDMDLGKLEFDTTNIVTTWWDVVDHYLLAVMFSVSLTSVGLQITQDRLICIPAVNCSNFERKDSVVRNWSEFSNILDICNRSPSYVVLTKMSDRRQYDYVDKECYKEMHCFYLYYSLIFLVEAVILLVISNFWQKYPDSANALAHCEYLVSEIMLGDLEGDEGDSVQADEGGEQERQRREQERRETVQHKFNLFRRLYGQRIRKINLSSLTWQYRLRGVVGLVFTILFLAFNGSYYSLSTGWTQCHLDGHIAFSTEHRFFQCTRSMELFFRVGLYLLFVFLTLHLFFVFGSFLWSVIGKRHGPEYNIPQLGLGNLPIYGDAAFLFHLMATSKFGVLIRFLHILRSQEERSIGEQRETSV